MTARLRPTWFLALAAGVLACRAPAPGAVAPLPGVPEARLALLTRGVNVTRWFRGFGTTPAFATYMSDGDLAAMRNLGFGVVRLAVNGAYLRRRSDPTVLDSTVLPQLDTAIDRIVAHRLAVIVTPFLRQPVTDSASGARLAALWEQLAPHLAHTNPDRVFLEVVNEPGFPGRARAWSPIQAQVLAVMRRAAPRHTLVATGAAWSTIDGLVALTPVADPNVVYTFHFYQSQAFTHQTARWAGMAGVHDVPYPADSTRCASTLSQLTDSSALRLAKAYCAQRWNAAAIGAALDRAVAWQRSHQVPIFAGEFGVFCAAPRADRLAWIRDVRRALEQRNIGWALWGWDDCFGLGGHHAKDGALQLDEGVLDALGLRD